VDDIYLGNGVSELITMSLMALLEEGDEILIPTPDYPLWTASVALAGGRPVHYLCDEESGWQPDLEDLEAKITPRTKGIVVINPNNPTGAVYPESTLRKIVALAEKHGLTIFADEIYEKILYEDAVHVNMAGLTGDDVLCLTFSGLSKAYRVCGYRAGWMAISGPKKEAADYLEGINLLANMRLCANVPAQHAIQTALADTRASTTSSARGPPAGTAQQGVRHAQRHPRRQHPAGAGALYLFPKLDPEVYNIRDDEKFVLDLLKEQKILVSPRQGLQLGPARPFPNGDPAERQGHRGSKSAAWRLPQQVSGELAFTHIQLWKEVPMASLVEFAKFPSRILESWQGLQAGGCQPGCHHGVFRGQSRR
jgi:alanine-synthesizing transaminase